MPPRTCGSFQADHAAPQRCARWRRRHSGLQRHAALARLQVRAWCPTSSSPATLAMNGRRLRLRRRVRIEARGVQLFEAIEGDHFTVLGMPLLASARRAARARSCCREPALCRSDRQSDCQSKSPAIHNFWLEKLGIAADYRACHVTAEWLGNYFAQRRGDVDWRGCNVTMPHKQAVMPLLDAIDPQAAAIGAVNTVVREADGRLVGYNTDAAGFLEPLRADLAQPHLYRMARILGAGGAARAIVAALGQGFTLVPARARSGQARALLDSWPQRRHHGRHPLPADRFCLR
jgi:hypothetical protein